MMRAAIESLKKEFQDYRDESEAKIKGLEHEIKHQSKYNGIKKKH